jgi:hypothetical protein
MWDTGALRCEAVPLSDIPCFEKHISLIFKVKEVACQQMSTVLDIAVRATNVGE